MSLDMAIYFLVLKAGECSQGRVAISPPEKCPEYVQLIYSLASAHILTIALVLIACFFMFSMIMFVWHNN